MKLDKIAISGDKLIATRLTRHPRKYIEKILRLAVYQNYGYEYRAGVTRQNKDVQGGSLKSVDYTFPCFDLSNKLGQAPFTVATAITSNLKKWLAKTHPTMLDNLRVEAVDGYVNFELSEEYLAEAAYYVAHWLLKPQQLVLRTKICRLLVAGTDLNSEKNISHSLLISKLIADTYYLASFNVIGRFIIHDSSEDAAELLAMSTISHKYSTLEEFRSHKADHPAAAKLELYIRQYLSGLRMELPISEKELRIKRDQYESVIADDLSEAGLRLKKSQESAMTDKVNHWLNHLKNNEKQNFIIDQSSKAVYYHIEAGPMASLRSASGVLFKAAYILYITTNWLHKIKKNDSIILIVPQVFHQLVYSLANSKVPASAFNQVVCMDPEVTYKSLSPIQHEQPLNSQLAKIAHSLGRAVSHKAYSAKQSRQDIIALIDVPIEFTQFTQQVRILELMRYIAQSIAVAESLNYTLSNSAEN